MIDPVSAFGLIVSAHKTIKKCVEMGRDLSSAQNAVMQYAKGEAELGLKERKRKVYSVVSWMMLSINILRKKNKKD